MNADITTIEPKTPTVPLFYIYHNCGYANGLFGTAIECAKWFNSESDLSASVKPVFETEYDDDDNEIGEVQVELYGEYEYDVYVKHFGEMSPRKEGTAYGKDEDDALENYYIELFDYIGGVGSEFETIHTTDAITGVVESCEDEDLMREIYVAAGMPGTDDKDVVKEWFLEQTHTKEALIKLIEAEDRLSEAEKKQLLAEVNE